VSGPNEGVLGARDHDRLAARSPACSGRMTTGSCGRCR